MNATTQPTIAQRSTAFALAAIVTLAMLGGIDALATRNVDANAFLAQHAVTWAANG